MTAPAAASTSATPVPADPVQRVEHSSHSGRRMGLLGAEVLVGSLVAAVVSLGLQYLISRTPAPYPSNQPIALMAFCLAVLLIVALVLAARSRWPRWANPLTWVGLSTMSTLPLALMLNGTRYYLGGLQVDQSFRTQYLTRMANSWSLADVSYQDAPPYYPGGWFWLGGRLANLLGLPGWAAFKPWAIVTLSVVAVINFALWSVVVRRQVAVLLAVATALIGLGPGAGATEPYSWLVVAMLPPLAVLGWRMLSGLRGTAREPLGTTVVLGVALGVFGADYTLLFGFFGLLLVLLAVINVVVARHGKAEVGPLVRRTLGRASLVGLIALGPVLVVWTPYLLAVLSGRAAHNAAARYLPVDSAYLPTPMLSFSVTGAICLAGLVWIVLTALRSQIAFALGSVVVLCYVWYGLSTLALFANTTLLAFRTQPLLVLALTCAAVFGALDVMRLAARHFDQVRVRALAAVMAFLALLAVGQINTQAYDGLVDAAFEQEYPTGGNGRQSVSQDDPDTAIPQVNAAIGQMTGKRPQDLVLLANNHVLLGGEPYWTYLALTPHYGNPLIDFDARRAAVAQWAQARTPEQLLADLDRSPGTVPTVFVLQRDPDKPGTASIDLNRDAFPATPNVVTYPVTFQLSAFDGPQFVRTDVGPFTVVARR